MILVDVNLMVYAHNRQSDRHAEAKRWFEDRLNLEPGVGLPWASLLGFLRVITNPRAADAMDHGCGVGLCHGSVVAGMRAGDEA